MTSLRACKVNQSTKLQSHYPMWKTTKTLKLWRSWLHQEILLLSRLRLFRSCWQQPVHTEISSWKPEISIHNILHKFPALKEPKWVSFLCSSCMLTITHWLYTHITATLWVQWDVQSNHFWGGCDQLVYGVPQTSASSWRWLGFLRRILCSAADNEEYISQKARKLSFTFAEVNFLTYGTCAHDLAHPWMYTNKC